MQLCITSYRRRSPSWIAHEASYSESARESVRSEALPGPTGASVPRMGTLVRVRALCRGYSKPRPIVAGSRRAGGSERGPGSKPTASPPARTHF